MSTFYEIVASAYVSCALNRIPANLIQIKKIYKDKIILLLKIHIFQFRCYFIMREKTAQQFYNFTNMYLELIVLCIRDSVHNIFLLNAERKKKTVFQNKIQQTYVQHKTTTTIK